MFLDLVPDWQNDASNQKVISFRLSLTIGQMQRNRQFHPDIWSFQAIPRNFCQQAGLKQERGISRESAYVCVLLRVYTNGHANKY